MRAGAARAALPPHPSGGRRQGAPAAGPALRAELEGFLAKNLVIVESPAKAKTINKFLGRNFTVKASMGHVRDLPKKRLGVDEKHDFKPTYEILPGRKKVIDDLKAAAESADKVFLAPDPDREGEAICWHLAEILKKTNI